MSDLRKVYLPKWMTWLALAMIVPMWALITYQAFVLAEGSSDTGLVVWIVATVFLGVFAVIMVLMGQRKLPAYLLEMGEDDEE